MHNPQETRELIIKLVKNKGTSVNKMLQECDIGKSTVDSMKIGKRPSAENLAIIANYLNVSTDFLLGNTPNDEKHYLLADELELVEDYRSLNDTGQEYIRQTMYAALNTYKKPDSFSEMENA